MTHTTNWRRLLDRPSPLLKQTPSLVAMLLALGLTVCVPDLPMTNTLLVGIGSGLVFAASVFSIWMSVAGRYEGFVILLIPIADIIGFGLFRSGTGGVSSLFGALMLLPVVWLATAPGLRYVVFVALLTSFNYMMTYLTAAPSTSIEWMRAVISPLAFASVAGVINELARQQRSRAEEAEQLVIERTSALNHNVQIVDQLQQKEREYRALLDSFESLWSSITAQAIFATDTQGKVQAWTPGAQQLFGLTVAEALDAATVDRFFPPSALCTLLQEIPEPATSGHSAHSEEDSRRYSKLSSGIRALFTAVDVTSVLETDLEVTTAAGHPIPARLTITQRRDGDGGHIGYLFVVTDESRAAEVARMKDEFVGMVSHEIRTPLSSILGFLDLLMEDPEQPLSEDQRTFAEVIERNANRLLALVNDLLFTAQVESGAFPLVLSSFDLNESVKIAVESAQPNAQRSDVTLVAALSTEKLVISADPVRIGQAIDNLVSNAIKFTPQGGQVTVGARAVDERFELWVRDTGFGVPEDEQDKLFTRFFRASTATRNAVPGIGLGLSIIRAIVLAHGGTMSVTSNEGEGSEFRILLPKSATIT